MAQTREQRAQLVGYLGAACAVVALYLVREHYDSGPSFCDQMRMSSLSCSTVNRSEYSEFLGVPVALFGAIWGAVMSYGAWRVYLNDRVAYFSTALLLWSSLGLLFIVYMVYAEFVLGAICIFCTIIHVMSLAIFYQALQLYMDMTARPSAGTFLYSMRNVILVVFLVCIVPVFLFNMRGPSPPHFSTSGTKTDTADDEEQMTYFINLAKCVTSKHVSMFGSDMCGVCKRQKASLGVGFKFIDYKDCSKDHHQKSCQDNNIDRYPTWIHFDELGEEIARKPGAMSALQLEEFADCKLANNA